MSSNGAAAVSRHPAFWVGGALSLVIVAVSFFAIWTMALPVTPPETMCIAIYPPTAGCAGDARLLPAAVWSILGVAALGATLVLGRRSWWGAALGVVLTALIGVAGYVATVYMRVFLIV
jgi:hypothetical protein